MLTRTIDEYVASLYERLRDSLAIARDCAVKEAQRQKWLYRSGTLNSNTVNSKFHLIRSFFQILARILSFHV